MSTPAPPATSPLPDEVAALFSTFGAALIGSWIAMVLYGLALAQTYMYFLEYPGDGPWIKVLVYVLWIMNSLHVIFAAHAVYQSLVINAFNISAISTATWSLAATVALRYVIHCMVLFYLVKLCVGLSSNRVRWWLGAVLVVPIVAYLAFGIDTVIRMAFSTELIDYNKFEDSTTIPTLTLQAICDIIVTATLCIILNKHKTAFKRTNTMINTLMVYAVNRGMLMVMVAMAELLLMVIRRHSLLYAAAEFIVAGLYVNSLLAILNSRHSVRGKGATPSSSTSLAISKLSFRRTTGQNNTDTGPTIQSSVDPNEKTGSEPFNTSADTVDISHCSNCGRSSASETV